MLYAQKEFHPGELTAIERELVEKSTQKRLAQKEPFFLSANVPAETSKAGETNGLKIECAVIPMSVEDELLGCFVVSYLHKKPSRTAIHVLETIAYEVAFIIDQTKKLISLIGSEQKYRLLTQNAHEAIFIVLDGYFTFTNQKATDITGFTAQELSSRPAIEFVHPEDRKYVFRHHSRIYSGRKECGKIGYRLIDMTGETRWIEAHSVPFFWEGKPALLCFHRDVTERKIAEEALKESEEKYRILIENTNEAVTVLQDNRVVFTNKKAGEITGFSEEELMKRPFIEFVFPDDRLLALEIYSKRLKGKETPHVNEYRVNDRAGNVKWMHANSVHITWNGGPAVLIFHTDITARKNAELNLKEREERLRLVVEGTGLGIWDLNVKTGEYIINDRFAEMLGYTKEEITPLLKNSKKYLNNPDDDSVLQRTFEEHLKGKTPMFQSEHRLRTKSGDWIWIQDRGRVVEWDLEGNPIRVTGTHLDITDRKIAEEALRVRDMAIRSSITAIAFADLSGEIVFINPAAVSMWGYDTEDEILHRYILEFFHTSESELPRKLNMKEDNWVGEMTARKKDGAYFYVQASLDLVRNEKGSPILFMGSFIDITERRKAEQNIKNSLKEKELLLREVHHRVKNNLQIISSLLDMKSMRTNNQDTADLFLDARNKIQTMALIHSQLYGSERFDLIDIGKHIEDITAYLSDVYSSQRKGIVNYFQIAKVFLPVTQAIPCTLVLCELISNAFKHAFTNVDDGEIIIAMTLIDQNKVYLRISDNGCGLPNHIDFDTTETLGLKLVRNLVRYQLGGEILVNRKDKAGSPGNHSSGTEYIIIFDKKVPRETPHALRAERD